MTLRSLRAALLPSTCLILAALVGGCGVGGGSTLTAASTSGEAVLTPRVETAVYHSADENTADIFLTDLPLGRLADPADDLRDLSGTVVHVRLFLVPAAGKTPIDRTACNTTVHQTIFAAGAVGIYGGGGFMSVYDAPAGNSMSASLRDVSLRLIRATPDFSDRLGTCVLTGAVAARRDDPAARAIDARISKLTRTLPAYTPR
ncbi:MAG: hypothetical protein ACT4PL_09640 [Phycisphaerales bacterium]